MNCRKRVMLYKISSAMTTNNFSTNSNEDISMNDQHTAKKRLSWEAQNLKWRSSVIIHGIHNVSFSYMLRLNESMVGLPLNCNTHFSLLYIQPAFSRFSQICFRKSFDYTFITISCILLTFQ